jgi:AMP phosphorylase
MNEAQILASDFIELSRRFGMQIECAITEGSQPVAYSIGPVLEAKEALETLCGQGPHEIMDKATMLAGILLEMMGQSSGKRMATDLILKGKSLAKMREIIEIQGGDPEVRPEDLVPGDYFHDIEATEDGMVLWFNNRDIVKIARAAGTPRDKKSGIKLFAKLGDRVSKGKPIYRIYGESTTKLENAIRLTDDLLPIEIGKRVGDSMLKKRVGKPTVPSSEFILER